MTFETDCQQMVKIITDKKEDDWPALLVKFEEFHYLHSLFNFCSLRFIPRSCNIRADALAKEARARGIIFSHVIQEFRIGWLKPTIRKFLNKIWNFRCQKKMLMFLKIFDMGYNIANNN